MSNGISLLIEILNWHSSRKMKCYIKYPYMLLKQNKTKPEQNSMAWKCWKMMSVWEQEDLKMVKMDHRR